MVTLDPPSSSTASVAITSPGSTPTPTQQSTFSLPKSTISRKKPPGLDISKSILRPTRSVPGLPPTGDSPVGNFVSEADKLRDDIAQLQLSSRSTGSHRSDDEAEAAGLQSDDSAASGAHKKEKKESKSGKDGKEKKRRKYKDKNGEDLVKEEDLESIEDLGAGNGGTVAKVWNKKRNCIMAKKLVMVDAKPSIRKQILRELQIMNDCDSPYIVGYYGCFPVDVHVGIVMEFMDAGSLDHVYRKNGPIDISIVGKCAEAVVRGLMYLYDEHRIIHRDIKPSNILVNTKGEVKICDFGVSGELINSIANTFVGTSTYMSPERIQGTNYTIKSDIWSLAISIIELATGRFPFSDNPDADDLSPTASDFDPDPTLPRSAQRPQVDKKERVSVAPAYNMSILDLLQYIVNEPAPKLASRRFKFPEEAVEWVDDCLIKDPDFRPGPKELLAMDWVANSKVTQDDLRTWAQSLKKD